MGTHTLKVALAGLFSWLFVVFGSWWLQFSVEDVKIEPVVELKALCTGVDVKGAFVDALMDGRKVRTYLTINEASLVAGAAMFVKNSDNSNLFATSESVVNEAALKVSPAPVPGPLGKGSCVIIVNDRVVGCGFRYKDYLITANHVYDDYIVCSEKVWLTVDGKKRLPCTPKKLSFRLPEEMDLAVLDVGNTIFSALGLSVAKIGYAMVGSCFLSAVSTATGESLQCFGYLNRNDDLPGLLHHTCFTTPGFSGAAVYQDKNVVAMHLRYDKVADRNVCVSLRELKRLMEKSVDETYSEATLQADVDRDIEQQWAYVEDAERELAKNPGAYPGARAWLADYKDELRKSQYATDMEAFDAMNELFSKIQEGDPIITDRMRENHGVISVKGSARVSKKRTRNIFGPAHSTNQSAKNESADPVETTVNADIKGSSTTSLSTSGLGQTVSLLSPKVSDSDDVVEDPRSDQAREQERLKRLKALSASLYAKSLPVVPPRPSQELLSKLSISVTPRGGPKPSSGPSDTKPPAISRNAKRKASKKDSKESTTSTQRPKSPPGFEV